ncbi:hypothetical protein ACFT30_13100 [Microbacterium ureisolvens]|uniref:hypothetical protein n=1 Tax=Microbacterium ureisolvens TaxID=2781186 RepID=UPI00363E18CF
MSTPIRVRVRMYQVGFGDCFLVSIEYDGPLDDGRAERHVLIDYGTSHPPRDGRADGAMGDVAALIEQHTGGVLDVLVVTHRHRDHLGGFGVDAGAEIMRRLAPKLVLRSWTEDPALPATADGPGVAPAEPPNGLSRASVRHAALLAQAQEHVAKLSGLVGLDDDVKAAAAEQLKNAEAVGLLDELSRGDRGRYLYAGMDSGIEAVIPGLRATVLGPPTVDQDPRVAKQRKDDPEYWLTGLGASLRVVGSAADPGGVAAQVSYGAGPVHWLIDRLANQRSHSVARLVRDLDDALNNTSVILLLEVEGVSMLFPGDAQIENWQHTLDRLGAEPQLRRRLADVDLYKVGHHGSRNATPRSLHDLWRARSSDARLAAVMSTREGVHGKADNAVPKQQLVTALREVGDLYSTDDLDGGEAWLELEADAAHGPFRLVPFAPPGP